MPDRLEKEGRLWLRGALDQEALNALIALLHNQTGPGARIGLTPQVATVLTPLTSLINQVQSGAFPTRLVAFSKTEGENWAVPWHQDRIIAVKARHEVDGFGNWSLKDGVWHCQPPTSVLRQMTFVRVHLDDNTAENGAMEILPGSHHHNLIRRPDAAAMGAALPSEICEAKAGDVLILNMMMLHRSLPSLSSAPRRVLRVDYASDPLPKPLEWLLK